MRFEKAMNGVGRTILLATVVLGCTVLPSGCGRQPKPEVTAEQLKQSFAKGEAPQQELVKEAGAALKVGDYTKALTTMDRAVQLQPANEEQKQAVGQLILQTRQAVKQDPKLNTPQLYKAMNDLITRVHGEN